MLNFYLDNMIKTALQEDIGNGDITTIATVSEDKQTQGIFIAKEDGIICGLPIVKRLFQLLDDRITIAFIAKEGELVKKGDIIAKIFGPARSILTGERVALNFLQHLCGIATRTHEAVQEIKGTNAVIVDTRKTTPGLREIEKYAVKVGGGSNHRHNLSDGILIKDNHIKAAGGITAAVEAVRKAAPHTIKIEVEVENFEMLDEALKCEAEIIMLDNMSTQDMEKAVRIIDGRALVEASGNMGEKDLRAVAKTGVNLISIGALTHTIRAMDISLKFVE